MGACALNFASSLARLQAYPLRSQGKEGAARRGGTPLLRVSLLDLSNQGARIRVQSRASVYCTPPRNWEHVKPLGCGFGCCMLCVGLVDGSSCWVAGSEGSSSTPAQHTSVPAAMHQIDRSVGLRRRNRRLGVGRPTPSTQIQAATRRRAIHRSTEGGRAAAQAGWAWSAGTARTGRGHAAAAMAAAERQDGSRAPRMAEFGRIERSDRPAVLGCLLLGSDRVQPRSKRGQPRSCCARCDIQYTNQCDPPLTHTTTTHNNTDTTILIPSIMKVAALLLAGLGLASAFVSAPRCCWAGGLACLLPKLPPDKTRSTNDIPTDQTHTDPNP